MISGKRKKETLDIQEKFKSGFFKNAETFVITGSGDAFASPVFRKLLQTLQRKDAPSLKDIVILTNGLLLPKYWDTLSDFALEKITTISVSIDAATEDLYDINRRGGDWDQLIYSLSYIRDLNVQSFFTSFVVQDNNFHQMKDFVLMSEGYNVRHVQFQIIEPDFIRDLGYEDYVGEWLSKAVQEKRHPRHQDLIETIQDKFFDPYISNFINENKKEFTLDMGPLYKLRNGEDISQYDKITQEKI